MKTIIVEEDIESGRLDIYLSAATEVTRSHIKNLIDGGKILVNGKCQKAGYIVKSGDYLEIDDTNEFDGRILPENIPLDIIYEDDDLAVINKSRGMTVHPAAGVYSGTLVNALMYKFNSLSEGGGQTRPGIVHRLDKDTTGLLVIAKNDASHAVLAAQISEKTAKRVYLALLEGVLKTESGEITTYITRDLKDRKKFAVSKTEGKLAVTRYNVEKSYANNTLCKFELKTGRTHQIRVHSLYLGHPVVGDRIYGYKKQTFKLDGQLLHSSELEFIHPSTKKLCVFKAELPADFKNVLTVLENKLL